MNAKELREKRRYLYEENKKFGDKMEKIMGVDEHSAEIGKPFAAYRSNKFLAQLWLVSTGEPIVRVSVNRSEINNDGSWKDEIRWEELMNIKREIGYGTNLAIEVYPPDEDIVNIANIRHLFVFLSGCPIPACCVWRKG